MLKEGREVRAGAEIANRNLFASLACGKAALGGLIGPPLLVDTAAQRTGNRAGQLAEKLLERGNGVGGELRPGDGDVCVEVGHDTLHRRGVLFHPLG